MADISKQHILGEIRRTADTNGGIPLGIKGFTTATGIKESQWRGRFWARWSDALDEAGYESNEWNTRTDEQVLCEKLTALAKRLGRYPTKSEMGLERRSDSSFPSLSAIARLGTKREQILWLLDSCESSGGDDQVIKILQDCLPAPVDREDSGRVRSEGRDATLFFDICEFLLRWAPARRRNTEEAYKSELSRALKDGGPSRARNLVREEKGESLCDIAIGDLIGIEAKKSLSLADYDRCFGQIARHLNSYAFVAVIVFDVLREEQFEDFCSLTEKHFGNTVRIIKNG